MVSNSIQGYIQQQRNILNEGIIASKKIDRVSLQMLLDWAESFAVSNIQTDIDKLANQSALSIDSYSQPIPKAIGCLTQLRSLTLHNCLSSNDNFCRADDKLPDSIIDLVNLETLSLVCKNPAFIPDNLHELKNIRTLEINFHDVNIIPETLIAMSCDIKLHLYSEQDKLPDNLVDIDALTELSIHNDYLTELPESISKLHNLKNLTINSAHLNKIPQNIGNLVNLTYLKLNCENLECLPESLGQLTSLSKLDIPNKLTDQLPVSLVKRYRDKELWIEDVSLTILYKPLADNYRLSLNGFFLTDDNWDEESLIDLKYKTGADLIIGLQTTEKSIKKFDVIDGIILCQDNEIEPIIRLIQNTIDRLQVIGVDYNDFRETMRFNKPAHLIKSCYSSVNKLDRAQKVVTQLLDQIPENIIVEGMIINIKTDYAMSLDEFLMISEAVENRVIEDKPIWYNSEIVDKPECCCIEAIYMVEYFKI